MRSVLFAAVLAAGVISRAHTAEQISVSIDNFSFAPAEVTVASGTRVVWTNHDDIPHTVTDASQAKQFKSPALDTGDSFAFAFTTPGTYHYFCALHPHMQGIVVVK